MLADKNGFMRVSAGTAFWGLIVLSLLVVSGILNNLFQAIMGFAYWNPIWSPANKDFFLIILIAVAVWWFFLRKK